LAKAILVIAAFPSAEADGNEWSGLYLISLPSALADGFMKKK